MKLFYSPTSPYARKVLVLIKELHLEDMVEIITVNPLENNPELSVLNPLGKVPTFVGDNDFILYDSPIICEYLCIVAGDECREKHFQSTEYDEKYFNIQRLQALADGLMDASFSLVMERRREKMQQSSFWMDRWLNAINRSLDSFAVSGHSSPFFFTFAA